MTGNIAIDVAIGLVFIYSLYSLMATTVSEFIAASLQLRAKNLKLAISRMLDDNNSIVLSEKFNNTPIIKYLSSNKFSKLIKITQYPSYMNAGTFSQALVYVLKDAPPSELSSKEIIQKKLDEYSESETGKYLLFLFNEANGDIDKFRKAIETWFENTMQRTTGWYKKNLTFITLGLGLIVAMLFNIDTFQMVKQLSVDENARAQYVQLAGDMLKNPQLNSTIPSFDTTLQKRLQKDTVLQKRLGKDSVAFKKFINDSTSKIISTTQKVLIHRMDTLYSLSQHAQSILSFKRTKCPGWFFNDWDNFLGCLVTAIALSLGSPFWFDLLNKLMKLRSSVASGTTNNNTPTPSLTDDTTKPAVG